VPEVANYEIRGSDKLIARIQNMFRIRQLLDPVYMKAARVATTDFIKETPKMTGTTARGWSLPRKIENSNYLITNKTTTYDKKLSLIEILDKGRGPVFPKIAKRLYIPLTNKGRSKKAGAPIPKGLVYGVDYVFAKKAGPAKGKFFIDKINSDVEKMIERESIAIIEKS